MMPEVIHKAKQHDPYSTVYKTGMNRKSMVVS
jgi:hypothetical protein